MNVSTTFGTSVFRRPLGAGPAAGLAATARRWAQQLRRMPLLLWSLVVAAALLAFFVHLLNEQVLRGQLLREEQRAAAQRPQPRPLAGDVQHPGNRLIVTRQPMTQP